MWKSILSRHSQLFQASTSLEGPFTVVPKPAAHDLDYRTHFERRMRLHDLPVYRAEFRKAGTHSMS